MLIFTLDILGELFVELSVEEPDLESVRKKNNC